jgi:hypothetical protein
MYEGADIPTHSQQWLPTFLPGSELRDTLLIAAAECVSLFRVEVDVILHVIISFIINGINYQM